MRKCEFIKVEGRKQKKVEENLKKKHISRSSKKGCQLKMYKRHKSE